MKGLLKGLRYISHVFEEEREPELQIGGPTDVKHVAHIGWDGPTATAPSWMTQFKGEGENLDPTVSDPVAQSPSKRKGSKTTKRNGSDTSSALDSPKRATADNKKTRRKKPKGSSSDAPSSSSKPTKVKKKKDKNGMNPISETKDQGG